MWQLVVAIINHGPITIVCFWSFMCFHLGTMCSCTINDWFLFCIIDASINLVEHQQEQEARNHPRAAEGLLSPRSLAPRIPLIIYAATNAVA
jgi:hypothetical protein